MSALERLKGWETMMLALLVAIVVFNSVGSPYFLSVGNFVNLFQLSIEKSIVALTMALIIIGGEIDLSIASVMGLSACVMAWTFHEGAPMPLAILIALSAGILAGPVAFQNAQGCRDVEAAKLAFQVVQVLGGDAVVFCAEKKQRHCRFPRKVERLRQDQQHFPVPVQQGAFDHVARQ